MRFFIDHKEKRIHRTLSAGDACGFNDTPAEEREFTSSLSYIEQLEEDQYDRCHHCEVNTISQPVK
ncbi:hypothetical protein [Alkalicoccus urumqiensis]|uniref:Uncharacterized protein n=1 Tax=Alkalicoccus urumqiensis TaxID=1548213 RepID=A0A2P6MJW1_ALKUR|nr:hypothetical protein [Alkalicoccus urumqiensis]PRO66569.1 hypothetical protein C6I21_04290 [Alkalicoccus urumqiensis]